MPAFTYWDSDDFSPLSSVMEHWRAEIGEFFIVGDQEVIKALKKIDYSAVSIYQKIRIPAARSDLARLVMLYRNGGLYVDSHCGINDRRGVSEVLRQAYTERLILVDQSRAAKPRPLENILPINAMIAGGKGSALLLRTINRVIENLHFQHREEAVNGFVPYDLLQLTGPKNIRDTLLSDASLSSVNYPNAFTLLSEDDFAVQRYRYKISNGRSAHWSERQRTELLFDS